MKTTRQELIEDLRNRTMEVIHDANGLRELPKELLIQKPAPDRWSILECLEHLNLYGDFYLVEIERCILGAEKSDNAGTYSSGWLGNYFAKMMLPGVGKMKTFKDKNPSGAPLTITTLDRFFKQQDRLLALLQMASEVNISKVRTAISISRWIKLRLGDTLRVVVYHNQRHILQAMNVKNEWLEQHQDALLSPDKSDR